jgi:hypothetical protein
MLQYIIDSNGYGVFFRSEFFFGQHRVRIFLFCPAKREFFFHKLTLGYMTKTPNQIFFPSTKIRIFFQQHWESEYFFRKKHSPPPPPPLEVKWSVPNQKPCFKLLIWLLMDR